MARQRKSSTAPQTPTVAARATDPAGGDNSNPEASRPAAGTAASRVIRDRLMKEIEDDLKHKTPDWKDKMRAWEKKLRDARPVWVTHKPELDGSGVVLFFIFAIALTESVSNAAFASPARVALYTALAFAICIVCFVATYFAWRGFDRREAITLALATGLRNTGLLIAVMGVSDVPEQTFLFFALMQFPIYFAPQLVKPFVGAMLGDAAGKERR